MATIDDLLRIMVDKGASDLHIKPMRPPLLRLDGRLIPLKTEPLRPQVTEKILTSLLNERQRKELIEKLSVDSGYSVPGVSRFRTNIFVQRGTYGAVFRRIPIEIPSLLDWGLPDVIKEFTQLHQGLVLVTGPTGSGKSSTLAAMIRYINETRYCHIITVEDPIEFLFRDDKAAISQREVGMDTPSFSEALRNALRQDPDVIMVGEMRDLPTIETAITASETGHLVLSTLHTNSAPQSIDRILDAFPSSHQKQVRLQLAQVLQGILSMKLIPHKDGQGRIAAVEICRNSPIISKMIEEARISEISEEMSKSVSYFKMQTLNQSLTALVVHNQISIETALSVSPLREELDLNLRKIYYSDKSKGKNMADCHSDYSKIEELLESKRLYSELQEKFNFELESREGRIRELQAEIHANDDRVQQAMAQMEKLKQAVEQAAQDKERLRDNYEKKFAQMRKQFEERMRMARGK